MFLHPIHTLSKARYSNTKINENRWKFVYVSDKGRIIRWKFARGRIVFFELYLLLSYENVYGSTDGEAGNSWLRQMVNRLVWTKTTHKFRLVLPAGSVWVYLLQPTVTRNKYTVAHVRYTPTLTIGDSRHVRWQQYYIKIHDVNYNIW